MSYIRSRRGRALGASGDVAAAFADWSAIHNQVAALQSSGKDVPLELLQELDAASQRLADAQNPQNDENPIHEVQVTPGDVAQYAINVNFGDRGAAFNAALARWAASGTWTTLTKADGSLSDGFDLGSAPGYVQDAYAQLFGQQNLAVATGAAAGGFVSAPDAIAPAAQQVAAPAQYLQGGVRFDDAGNVYDGTGTPTGQTITKDQMASLFAKGANVQASDVPDSVIYDAVDAVTESGGDPSQATALVDSQSGAAVAVIQQLPSGSISVKTPTSAHDVAGIVNTVTGFIDQVSGTLQNVGTEVKKIGNAIQGGAAGAQAGYNAPTNWTPYLIGGALLAGVFVLPKILRK